MSNILQDFRYSRRDFRGDCSDGLWRRAGGDSKFLGSTLTVNATTVTIVGIAPPG